MSAINQAAADVTASQRNLTAYSEDLTGVSTFADGVVRLSRAGFVEGAL